MLQRLRTLLFLLSFVPFLFTCEPVQESQNAWPEITTTTKPWTRWWWHGSGVTKEGITRELESYRDAGIGGVEITPIYGVIGEENQFITYLSDAWVDMLEYTLQEAERLGLGVDMATGTGWPFGGPWVDKNEASKYITYKKYQLREGEQIREPIQFQQSPILRSVTNQVYQLYGTTYSLPDEPVSGNVENPALIEKRKALQLGDLIEPVAQNPDLQVLALDQVRFENELPLQCLLAYSDQGEIVPLTDMLDDNNILSWKAPEGNWTVYAVFQGWHGKMVERAAPGGEGNVIDHFSTPSIKHYLDKFNQAFDGRDISYLRSFFNDSYEVDDARGQANWTDSLFIHFQSLNGYDLHNYLPALFGESDAELNSRVLIDFRNTISELLLTTFTREWHDWAHDKGALVRNQAHGSPANILDLYAASDIPETEGSELVKFKFASSAAHVSGKPLVSAEAVTWLNEHFQSNLWHIKQNIEHFWLGGINHVFYHGTCYSPESEPWPGRLFYAAVHMNPRNSLWPDVKTLNDYISRTQSFLQQGKPKHDILLYFPIYDRFAERGYDLLQHFDGQGQALDRSEVKSIADMLLDQGYGFDFISDKQIENLQGEESLLVTGGMKYKTIIIPKTNYIPLNTMNSLMKLMKNGAKIIFHKTLPNDITGNYNLSERRSTYGQLLDNMHFDSLNGDYQESHNDNGSALLGEGLISMLTALNITGESMVDEGLQFVKRQTGNKVIYYVSNWSDNDFDGWITLSDGSSTVNIYDPMFNQGGRAKTRSDEQGLFQVYIQLSKGQSLILESGEISRLKDWDYYENSGEPFEIDGNWSIKFLTGGPSLPSAVNTESLTSWTSFGDSSYTAFSGTAAYEIEFDWAQDENDGYWLDLGDVNESATVLLNGAVLGTVIGPTYKLFIPADMLKTRNQLTIKVSNLMANRISFMDKHGARWKKFYNVNFPARRGENRDEMGLFNASRWSPMPSGLLGPVILNPLRKRQF